MNANGAVPTRAAPLLFRPLMSTLMAPGRWLRQNLDDT